MVLILVGVLQYNLVLSTEWMINNWFIRQCVFIEI